MIKLTDNPNERKKIFALMGVGGLALLYVLFVFVVQPYLSSIQTKKARVSELEEDLIWRARRDLAGVDSNMENNAALVRELLVLSEVNRVILRPSLGNYLLVASAVIKEAAQGLSISIDNINEVPAPASARTTAPAVGGSRPPSTATARFTTYTVNVSLSGGMHALVEFTGRLEHKNTYLAITRLIIMENQEADPETHFISMHIQWPIWVDNDHPRRLEAEQIADEERQ